MSMIDSECYECWPRGQLKDSLRKAVLHTACPQYVLTSLCQEVKKEESHGQVTKVVINAFCVIKLRPDFHVTSMFSV